VETPAQKPTKCFAEGCTVAPVSFPLVENGLGVKEIWAFCGPHADEADKDSEEQSYENARNDFNVFAELVCTDDETGVPIKQAAIHKRWAYLADNHDRLIIWSHVEAGKTTQLSILRTVWELGNNTRLRFVILSNTNEQASIIVRSIANYIENNETVQKIFPALKKDPNGIWTTTSLQVKRPNKAKDPSVRAVGVHGALTGGRIDRLIVDDILDGENTDSPASRKKLESWVRSTAFSRLTKKARVLIVGNAWHPEDLLHELAANGQYHWVRFPILDKLGNITWPQAWSRERIEKKRVDCGSAEEFARQMLCQARDDASSRFKKADIDKALVKGRALTLVTSIADVADSVGGEVPEGCHTFTGVDLAMSKKKKSDDTVFFTFMEDAKGNRTVLNIEIGKFSAPQIVEKIVDHYQRYKSTIAVESNAAQAFIIDFTKELTNVPIVPHLTTRAKRDPVIGVESLSVELANGKWVIPSHIAPSSNVERWIREMLFYSPHTHTGDVLMACYFAREVARRTLGAVSGGASVTFKALGVSTKPAQTEGETFHDRINTVSTMSDEEAREKDKRGGAKD
jgi:hypothetical protein